MGSVHGFGLTVFCVSFFLLRNYIPPMINADTAAKIRHKILSIGFKNITLHKIDRSFVYINKEEQDI